MRYKWNKVADSIPEQGPNLAPDGLGQTPTSKSLSSCLPAPQAPRFCTCAVPAGSPGRRSHLVLRFQLDYILCSLFWPPHIIFAAFPESSCPVQRRGPWFHDGEARIFRFIQDLLTTPPCSPESPVASRLLGWKGALSQNENSDPRREHLASSSRLQSTIRLTARLLMATASFAKPIS